MLVFSILKNTISQNLTLVLVIHMKTLNWVLPSKIKIIISNADSLSLGSLKFGFSHKLNSKKQLAFSLSKNFAKDTSVSAEIGV